MSLILPKLHRASARPSDPDGFRQSERQASIEIALLLAMVLATVISVAVSMWRMHASEVSAQVHPVTLDIGAHQGGS